MCKKTLLTNPEPLGNQVAVTAPRRFCGGFSPTTNRPEGGHKLAFDLPKPVLEKLRNLFNANPLQLSDTEQSIAKRVEICAICHYVWYRRAGKKPARCAGCHSRLWDRPLISALVEAHTATHPTTSTTPPVAEPPTPRKRKESETK